MAKIPKTQWELAPEGTHNAECIQFIDMGTQKTTFNGKEGEARQCRLYFHLVDEKTKDGKNVVIFQKYTYSPSPKGNLMKMLKAWLGVKDSNFDMDDIIGKPALVTVQHSDNGDYANVVNVAALTKGAKISKSKEPHYSLHLNVDDFDANVFNELPEGLQGKIADTKEYLEASATKPKKKKVEMPAKKAGKK